MKRGVFGFLDYELPSLEYKDGFYELHVEKEELKAQLKWEKKDRFKQDDGGKLKGKMGNQDFG